MTFPRIWSGNEKKRLQRITVTKIGFDTDMTKG